MLTVRIDNRLRMSLAVLARYTAMGSKVVASIKDSFRHKNPAHGKQKAMGYKYTKEPKFIETWAEEGLDLTVPRGGIARLCDILDEFGVEHEFDDDRSHGADLGNYVGDWVTPQIFPEITQAPWSHQERIVQAILKRQNCLVQSPTGSGKTSALLLAIQRAQVPAIVVMNDTKLLKQWQKRITKELGIRKKDQGLIQGKTRRLAPITLAMQQSLWNFTDSEWEWIRDKFGFMALDEVQFAAARTVMDVADRFTSHYRVGISADETRKDQKEFLTYDIFGDVAARVDRADLVNTGIIFDVDVRIVPTDYTDEIYEDQRKVKGSNAFDGLLKRMMVDDDRNDIIRRLVKSLDDAGDPTLVFSHRVEHCVRLDADFRAKMGIPGGLLLGDPAYADEFETTMEDLLSGDIKLAVGTYKAIGTGHDIPPIVAGIAATPLHTNRQFFNQLRGRICRRSPETNKDRATLYVLWDQHLYGRVAIANFLKWCNDVKVWSNNEWVEAREYMEERYGRKTNTPAGSARRVFSRRTR